jgi:hypothetical protein
VPFITFHPYIDRFYIIENVGFGQVYILDLSLLLTQNIYLKLFIINFYAPNQKTLLVVFMRFIILFSILIHTIMPTLILLFVIISGYFVVINSLFFNKSLFIKTNEFI